jgi:hypothetical protein
MITSELFIGDFSVLIVFVVLVPLPGVVVTAALLVIPVGAIDYLLLK